MDNTDNQAITYNSSDNSLSITNGNTVSLGSMVAFRALKTIITSAPLPLSNIDFLPDQVEYNDATGLNIGTGEFTSPATGLYTFDVKYNSPSISGQKLMLFKNGNLYEYLESQVMNNTTIFRTLTIKLVAGDKIKVVINTGTGIDIGTGTFSGNKVY
jgi:hypothetical protein